MIRSFRVGVVQDFRIWLLRLWVVDMWCYLSGLHSGLVFRPGVPWSDGFVLISDVWCGLVILGFGVLI